MHIDCLLPIVISLYCWREGPHLDFSFGLPCMGLSAVWLPDFWKAIWHSTVFWGGSAGASGWLPDPPKSHLTPNCFFWGVGGSIRVIPRHFEKPFDTQQSFLGGKCCRLPFVRGYYFWKVGINKFLDIAEWRAKERANERANGRANVARHVGR